MMRVVAWACGLLLIFAAPAFGADGWVNVKAYNTSPVTGSWVPAGQPISVERPYAISITSTVTVKDNRAPSWVTVVNDLPFKPPFTGVDNGSVIHGGGCLIAFQSTGVREPVAYVVEEYMTMAMTAGEWHGAGWVPTVWGHTASVTSNAPGTVWGRTWLANNTTWPSGGSKRGDLAGSVGVFTAPSSTRRFGRRLVRYTFIAVPVGTGTLWDIESRVMQFSVAQGDFYGSADASAQVSSVSPPVPRWERNTIGSGGAVYRFKESPLGYGAYFDASYVAGITEVPTLSTVELKTVTAAARGVGSVAVSEARSGVDTASVMASVTAGFDDAGTVDDRAADLGPFAALLPEPFKSWFVDFTESVSALTSRFSASWWFLNPWSYFDETRS